jgi:hypothetical protein
LLSQNVMRGAIVQALARDAVDTISNGLDFPYPIATPGPGQTAGSAVSGHCCFRRCPFAMVPMACRNSSSSRVSSGASKGGKFRSPVKGDTLTQGRGRDMQVMLDSRHDAGGMPTGIAGEDGKPAAALDPRGEVGFAIFQSEDHQVAFPMTKAAAITDFGRAFANGVGQGDMQTAGLARIALPSRSTGNRQKAPQALASSVRPIDELVDGLMTDGFTITAMRRRYPAICSGDQAADKRSAI